MKYFLVIFSLLFLSACSFSDKPSEAPGDISTVPAVIENSWVTTPTLSGSTPIKDVEKIPVTPHDAKVIPKPKVEEPVTKTATGVADDKEVEAVMKDIDAIFADIANEKK